MYLRRVIDGHLSTWCSDKNRKPLLLRGARQVGKSSAVRELGKQFKHYLEVNFEERRDVHALFTGNLSPHQLGENLAVLFNTPVQAGETLLFLDEIQQCPNAITALRFFYEKWPALHVIAAGSLLEFALQDLPSFGVGRIRSCFMYPFSFNEFLWAMQEDALVTMKWKASPEQPLTPPVHQKLTDYLKRYLLIGGMPEAVAHYAAHKDLLAAQPVLDDLIISLQADFVKYRKKVPALRLQEVFQGVLAQTGSKFVYKHAAAEAAHLQIKEAVELLIMAGLVVPATHTSANGIPLGAELNTRKQKMLLLDMGIYHRLLGLPLGDILLQNGHDMVNKGSAAELFAGLEIMKSIPPWQQPELYYWHREAKSSNAEVDYVWQQGRQIVPIEVKAGTKGSMQSMLAFLAEKKQPLGIRTSLEPYGNYHHVLTVPLYCLSDFLQYHLPAYCTTV